MIRIPTIDDIQEATLDEMEEAEDRATNNRIAQEIDEANMAAEEKQTKEVK